MAGPMLTLHSIANAMGGKVKGNRVRCPGPEAAYKKGYKAKRYTFAIWLTDDGEDIRVQSHHEDYRDNWRHNKDWAKSRLGITWKPKPKKRAPQPPPPFEVRNQFFGESLRISRYRGEGRI